MEFRTLYSELRRRSVFKVTALYAVGAWAVIQVAATVFIARMRRRAALRSELI
jgi:hypothetical protein